MISIHVFLQVSLFIFKKLVYRSCRWKPTDQSGGGVEEGGGRSREELREKKEGEDGRIKFLYESREKTSLRLVMINL